MFARKEPAVLDVPAPPEPRREKVAPTDAKIFQPSTFASRKAEAEAAIAVRSRRRLVSLGASDFPQRRVNGDVEVVTVEVLFDLDKPSDRFVSFPGQHGLVPLQGDERRETVTDLAPVKGGRLSRPAGSHDPSPPAAPPRPI